MSDTLRASESGLAIAEGARQRRGWNRTANVWLHKANVSQSTLNRFWASKPIQRASFIAICEAVGVNWQEITDASFPGTIGKARSLNPSPQAVPTLTREPCLGRDSVLQRWQARSPLRMLLIVGITGIGKTVLAQHWVDHVKDQYDHYIAINFESRATASFIDVATYCLSQLSQSISATTMQDPEQVLDQWVSVLEEQSCLIVIDSLEEILIGNEQNGWSQFQDNCWEQFFHRVLGLERCASQVVVTSQDIPGQVEVHGLRYCDRFHCELLFGLEPEVQHQLFQQHGLLQDNNFLAEQYLQRIGAAYEGHPLALRVIAGDILAQTQGDVVAYWQQYGSEIEALEQLRSPDSENHDDPQSPELRLDRYSRRLRRAVRDRIERSFTRLRTDLPDAYLLLCLAAVYRESVTEEFLLRPLLKRGWDEGRSLIALDALIDRCLLELSNNHHLRQHNLIRSIALDHLQGLSGAAS